MTKLIYYCGNVIAFIVALLAIKSFIVLSKKGFKVLVITELLPESFY
jgi:hypothetical protein